MPDLLDRLKAALADRCAIQEEIGAGGMASVYLAEDLKHHRKVAVKVLRPEIALGKRSAWTEHQCSLIIGRQIVAAHVRAESSRDRKVKPEQ